MRPIYAEQLQKQLALTGMDFVSTEVLVNALIPAMPTANAIPYTWIRNYQERHICEWEAISIDCMLDEWEEYRKKSALAAEQD